jgi:hypothetical protein
MKDIPKTTSFYFVALCFVAITSFAGATTFPQDLDYSYYSEVLIDAGNLWQFNSTFHPFAFQSPDSSSANYIIPGAFSWMSRYLDEYASEAAGFHAKLVNDLGVIVIPGLGISGQSGVGSCYNNVAVQPFIWAEARFLNNWYARLYIRATNEVESLPHYTGMTRDISRAGFNTAEIDQSVLGYQNDWINVDYGRNREIWGPLAEDNLLLAGNAPAWERIMVQMTYCRFSYRWFYGFLEAVYSPEGENINRYLVGRALEYRNRHNLVLSIGEVSTLSGPDRPVDWAFLNPFAVHLEIEQNKRENFANSNRSNDIIFLNADWLPIPSLRLSGSFALDEFQIDRQDREEGDADALGLIGRFAWTPLRIPIGLTIFGYAIRVDSFTMQHSYGYTNLVNRGEMIGHPLGNDTDEIVLGVRLLFSHPFLLELKIGQRRWGDNSLLKDPYAAYERHVQHYFPMGEVKTNQYLALEAKYRLFGNLHLDIDGLLDLKHSGQASVLEAWSFSVRYQKPFSLTKI